MKFLERIAGSRKRLYQFTAIDDCTRIRVLKIYDACNQAAAIRFMDEVLPWRESSRRPLRPSIQWLEGRGTGRPV